MIAHGFVCICACSLQSKCREMQFKRKREGGVRREWEESGGGRGRKGERK